MLSVISSSDAAFFSLFVSSPAFWRAFPPVLAAWFPSAASEVHSLVWISRVMSQAYARIVPSSSCWKGSLLRFCSLGPASCGCLMDPFFLESSLWLAVSGLWRHFFQEWFCACRCGPGGFDLARCVSGQAGGLLGLGFVVSYESFGQRFRWHGPSCFA